MLQWHTSSVIKEADKRAVSIASQLNQGNTPSLEEFKNNVVAGDIEFSNEIVTANYEGQFGLMVSNVPYKICNNLLDVTKQVAPTFRALVPKY